MVSIKVQILGLLGFLAWGLISCGEKKPKSKPKPRPVGTIEKAFLVAGGEHKIPSRFLIAAGLLESNLSPRKSSAVYQQTEEGKTNLGFSTNETAFGVPLDRLGLVGNAEAESLPVQIDHYAKALRRFFTDKAIELNSSPQTVDEKFQWIWQISQFHRGGETYKRTSRAFFAKELIQILNEGRAWQDRNSGEHLELTKEPQPIKPEQLNGANKELLTYDSGAAEIAFASLLLHNPDSSVPNHPTHIRVVHCPMTLSACLEIQSGKVGEEDTGKARLGAHYLIPQDSALVAEPLQVNKHNKSVFITDVQGKHELIQNAIVVMLVGKSGRYVNGVRSDADPTWFTPWQLRRMGLVIRSICTKFKDQDENFDYDRCVKPQDAKGVMFMTQGASESYRWGDLPDFDHTIFAAYISSKDGFQDGSATFEFPSGKRRFRATEPFKVKVRFQVDVHWVSLERAVRCPGADQKIRWTKVYNNSVRSKVEQEFAQTIYDGGPNSSGEQFFRVMVYGGNNLLLGWAIDKLFVYDFDSQERATSPTDCVAI